LSISGFFEKEWKSDEDKAKEKEDQAEEDVVEEMQRAQLSLLAVEAASLEAEAAADLKRIYLASKKTK